MYELAKKLGIEYIATGHYAKVEYNEEYGKYVIKKSKAAKKDQTYVLYNIPSDLKCYFFKISLITSPAIIIPATLGTNEILPGTCFLIAHVLLTPGGQTQ